MQKTKKKFENSLFEYDYHLPQEKIAQYPVEPRHNSKLLFYNKGNITHHIFENIVDLLPKNSYLVFNNTKVIPARLFFQKETGAMIEIFLLKPYQPAEVVLSMQSKNSCIWQCLIGNKKRWKRDIILEKKLENTNLKVIFFDEEENLVKFEWTGEINFAQMIEEVGKTPLPPYMKRQAEEKDKLTYQTVYSEKKGAVAAPTAGLHFTEKVFEDLESKGFSKDFITLHVSGGTFQPVKTENYKEHPMHSEQLHFSQKNIKNLLNNLGKIIVVGTTSMRALESLFWFGVKLLQKKVAKEEKKEIVFFIEKLFPYSFEKQAIPTTQESLNAVLEYMQKNGLQELFGQTEIYIFPQYQFQICKGLITNYHQPKSTLMLLVAAFIGEDWKKVYQSALEKHYRFLSYGDSSLLLP